MRSVTYQIRHAAGLNNSHDIKCKSWNKKHQCSDRSKASSKKVLMMLLAAKNKYEILVITEEKNVVRHEGLQLSRPWVYGTGVDTNKIKAKS